ncbi:MBL fold metallo-hydrolase [Chryseomicrobium palamuruense]|uniref:MBL fold metallo-hydrolase n=1 Tax=Chryseomicrobium palamuruense TaxID=682973 RepID=A0ABV8UW90_9BACL
MRNKKLWVAGALLAGAAAYLVTYPAFGKRVSRTEKKRYDELPHYTDGKFRNTPPIVSPGGLETLQSLAKDFFVGKADLHPANPMPTEKFIREIGLKTPHVTWFGHSCVLVEWEDKVLLVDPMFGKVPLPFPIKNMRYPSEEALDLNDLPVIDWVVYSHDHYDHLDYDTVQTIKDRVRKFIVPLGVGKRLEGWGVPTHRIFELDWWESYQDDGIRFHAASARHFSGRLGIDYAETLWCSWVFEWDNYRIFYSGDSGYGQHFEEIGRRYGPFDLVLMECGQYDERWPGVHMHPNESMKAFFDTGGAHLMPIHWGAFTLAFHTWDDPPEQMMHLGEEHQVHVVIPKIGEKLDVAKLDDYETTSWWKPVI